MSNPRTSTKPTVARPADAYPEGQLVIQNSGDALGSASPILPLLPEGHRGTAAEKVAELGARLTQMHEQVQNVITEIMEKQDGDGWPDLTAVEEAFQRLVETTAFQYEWNQRQLGNLTLARAFQQRYQAGRTA